MPTRDYLTIVSGLPRSGTSLTMQMIHAGGIPALTDQLRQPDADNPRGYYEFEPVKKTKHDPTWVAAGVGKVVKMVHLLLQDLPEGHRYRVVFTRRSLDEVVQSQNVMLERQGKSTAGLPPERIKQLFATQIEEIQSFMKTNADRFQFQEVDYNQLLSDPNPIVHRVSGFLDGLDTAAMLRTIDTSLYRNRGVGPVFNRST